MQTTLKAPAFNPVTGLLDPAGWYVSPGAETTVTDYLGADWTIPAGVLAFDGARVVDLGGGVFEFYSRDEGGQLIDPPPTLRYEPPGKLLHPSAGAIDPNEGSLFMELTLPVSMDDLKGSQFAFAVLDDKYGIDDLLIGFTDVIGAALATSYRRNYSSRPEAINHTRRR